MRNKLKLYIISVVFIVLVFFIVLYQMNTQSQTPLSVEVLSDNKTETINLWESEDGSLYAFLPSYAASTQVYFRLNTNNNVYCDGILIENGMPCDLSAEEKIHTLTYTEWGKERFKQLVFLTSANVPAMYIDTQSGSMDYIHEKKGNEEAGTIRVYAADGEISYTGDLESIKGRGNATWTQHEKKPYSICLAVEENLLGLGKAQKWILLANAADHSNIRNKLVYDFAAQTGLPYSPNSQWVDLCLNGEYAGLYLLSEKNEIHEQRVDITPDNSYLVSIEPKKRLDEQVIPYVETSLHALRVHNPERANEETLAAIMAQLQTIENAMMSHDGIDPLSGEHFQDIADMNSWIKNYLVDEAFGNLDAFMASRYFYLDALGSKKVSAGPVWDYDLALGNDTDISWSVSNPNVQVVHRYAHEYSKTHSWAHELYEKPWFKEGLVAEFENMLPEFNYVLNTKIKEYSDYIRTSAEMDRIRWLYSEEGTFDQEVFKVYDYLEKHIEFLEDIWLNESTYYQVTVSGAERDHFFTVPYAGYIKEMPTVVDNHEKIFVGWYYYETDEPFDINKPITEDTEIYAKWEEKSTSKIKQVVKLAPLGVIAFMGLALLVADLRKQRRS